MPAVRRARGPALPPRHQRVALIEIGTNTTKFLIADVFGNAQRVRHFEARTTRIGRGLKKSGRISHEALDATVTAVAALRKKAAKHRADLLIAVATYALRKAANADAVQKRIGKAAGVPLKILTGREEAHFAFLSASNRLKLAKPHTLLIDIGGGSTEVVLANRRRIERARSIPIGALHLTERFVRTEPIDSGDFSALETFVDKTVRRHLAATGADRIAPGHLDLVASGGSVTTIARVIAAGNKHIDWVSAVRSSEIHDFLERCLSMTLARRKRIPGLDPKRADIIPAGLAVVVSFMKALRKRTLRINDGGVRNGVIYHLIENDFEW
jgi:exopolyphosphatase/guanosine-5'-triphosphate,3'-diphosphate pyrophosphatase